MSRSVWACALILCFSLPAAATERVEATLETSPVPSDGDAADDMAVWIHPDDASQSLIIGTDKRAGLVVYDLEGNQIQFLPIGRPNNVDVRYNFPLGGQDVDLVTTGNRSGGHLAVYKVNPASRRLENVAARNIPFGIEIYGFCMYLSPVTGKYYCFGTAKDGRVEQIEVFDNGSGLVDGVSRRIFDVGGQVEGCVADDLYASLYVGEEDEGIWKYGAEPDAGSGRTLIDDVDGNLTADVEGLSLYSALDGTGYLLASSQGSHDYAVYERTGTHAFRMKFKIANGAIDGTHDTDGIDVTNVALNAMFPQGAFLAQDGSNDDGHQNFKLVPWQEIANVGGNSLKIDTLYDPRAGGADPVLFHTMPLGEGVEGEDLSFHADAGPSGGRRPIAHIFGTRLSPDGKRIADANLFFWGQTDAAGRSDFSMRVPDGTAGSTYYVQTFVKIGARFERGPIRSVIVR